MMLRATLSNGEFGKAVSIGTQGLRLELDIPPNVDLERAELHVQAPDDSVEIELKPAINTSKGPLDEKQSLDWISVDWAARRPITFVDITSAAGKGRLRVSEGGPWYPPLPFDVLNLNTGARLSGVTATRLLVEPLDAAGKIVAPAKFSAFTLKVGARPADFWAAIEGERPFFHHPLLLAQNEVLTIRDELTTALRRAWPESLSGGKITIALQSSADAILSSVRLSLTTSTVIRTWDDNSELYERSLEPGEQAEAFVAMPSAGSPESLTFVLHARPRPETVPLLPEPQNSPLVGHLIGSGFRAAQGFSTPDVNAALVGIDLYLRPLTPLTKGTVTIYGDTFGRPADAPFDQASAEFTISKENPSAWSASWIHVDLPAAALVGAQVFWVVLDVALGEALWLIGDAPEADPKNQTTPRGSLFQSAGDRVWRERDPPPSYIARIANPYAYARPRFGAQAPPPNPAITVHWGQTAIEAEIGEGGLVVLDNAALAKLSRPAQGDQRIRIRVRSGVGTEVTLAALEMRIPSSKEFA